APAVEPHVRPAGAGGPTPYLARAELAALGRELPELTPEGVRRGWRYDERRHDPVPRHPQARAGSQLHRIFATRWLIWLAWCAAPKPLSMLTTDTPGAHELSIARSAAMPPKDAPYPTLV